MYLDIIIKFVMFYFVFKHICSCYLDPGTGSIILTAIIAFATLSTKFLIFGLN